MVLQSFGLLMVAVSMLRSNVIEEFIQGKHKDPSKNEDLIVITDNHIAILDGTTDKSGLKIKNESTGRFAVSVAADQINRLSPNATLRTLVDAITTSLDNAIIDAYDSIGININDDKIPRPGLTLVAYSKSRGEIWRVGDGTIRIDDDIVHEHFTKIDVLTSRVRSLRLQMAQRAGASIDDLRRCDVGRECILPLLKNQHLFANDDKHEYGYACLNGKFVPDRFLEVFSVSKEVREIVLASDGYPVVHGTLQKSEHELQEILRKDPLLFDVFKSTKGLGVDNLSFDDRAYIRFVP